MPAIVRSTTDELSVKKRFSSNINVLIETRPFNQVVVGSIPTGLTRKINELGQNQCSTTGPGKHGVSMANEPIRRLKVNLTKDGKEFEGEYYTERGLVIVHYGGRRKSTQQGASAENTARMLLRELIIESE